MAKRVAAFGEVMMRLEVPGYALLSQSNTLHYTFSGTGVNVVSALSRFGHTGYVVTTLPDNGLGAAALSYLQKLGIQPGFVARGGAYVGSYFLENGFGARPSRVTYTNRLSSSFNTVAEGFYDVAAIADAVDLVSFCGITLAMNDTVRSEMKRLAKEVKQRGGTVVFDCNYRPSLWGENGYELAKSHYEEMLQLADIVMMNEKDALYILGMPSAYEDREAQLTELIPQVAQKYGISVIAGTHRHVHPDNTHSLRGFIYKDQSFTFSEVFKFAVYDRIGAGDAFTSGIIHGVIEGWQPEETVTFAAGAGMLAHTIAGDTPMSTEREIRQAITQSARDVER